MTENASWRKASYSNQSGNCAEIGQVLGVVLVRDTKDCGSGSVLQVSPGGWKRFTASIKC